MILDKYNNLLSYAIRHFKTLLPFLTPYKLFNVLRTLYEMTFGKTICKGRPFIYRIDPCSLCNLACVSCTSYNAPIKENRVMEYNDFCTIIDKIKKYALRTSLYDGGEPLLNKNIYKMIGYASKHKISTNISTNFNIFSQKNVAPLLDSKLTVLEPCLDGFTQENYEKYRVKGNVDTVKNGITMVMEEKRIRKVSYPYVDVQVIAFNHIKKELPLINNFLKTQKVDKITIRKDMLGFNERDAESKEERDSYKNVEVNKGKCFWLYLGMMVKPDGKVYPCCGGDFHTFPFGDLTKESLDDIWNNKYYKFARSLFNNDKSVPYDKEMAKIPCFKCNLYSPKRKINFSEKKIITK